ncbi:hypothetical protein [Pedobacter insulae]|uniref:Uncharacterized protein n=1 Tax=Pedobacter insulae TaxID=414048 RepID=A0A1I2TT21_9SPHI|nr:hypothetical protein [Pedobacter insulae]SFG65626.1 hypothetical protein SAMN04489864_101472 [Pedobacter insulae]
MKNSIKIFGSLAIIVSVLFACKKSNDEIKAAEKPQKFSVAIQMANTRDKVESGIVVGTKAELDKAFSETNTIVYLKKDATKANLFIPDTGTTGPVDPVDPSALCWDEINSYYDAHIAGWLAIANQTCKPYLVCITCPNAGGGLYVMYMIKPTSFRCATIEPVSASYKAY